MAPGLGSGGGVFTDQTDPAGSLIVKTPSTTVTPEVKEGAFGETSSKGLVHFPTRSAGSFVGTCAGVPSSIGIASGSPAATCFDLPPSSGP